MCNCIAAPENMGTQSIRLVTGGLILGLFLIAGMHFVLKFCRLVFYKDSLAIFFKKLRYSYVVYRYCLSCTLLQMKNMVLKRFPRFTCSYKEFSSTSITLYVCTY